jgi:hypothetical protein
VGAGFLTNGFAVCHLLLSASVSLLTYPVLLLTGPLGATQWQVASLACRLRLATCSLLFYLLLLPAGGAILLASLACCLDSVQMTMR